MKIVVYTLPYELAHESKKIDELFRAGLQELHLRKPGYSKKEYVSLLNAIDTKYHDRLVLHHHFSLAKKYRVKGIHTSPDYFDGLFGKIKLLALGNLENIKISTTIVDITKLKNTSDIFEAIFVGPLYKKYSEGNIKSNFDTFEMKKAISNTKIKTYAMGGINLKNQRRVESLGFSGLILQSGIWKSDNVLNAFNAFQLGQLQVAKADRNIRIA